MAFLAFPARRAAEQVAPSTEEMVRAIGNILSQIISQGLNARTAEEFRKVHEAEFSRYLQVMLGFSRLLTASVDGPILDRLTTESLSEMESELGESQDFFGAEVAEQAAFTVWTLGKISHHVTLCNKKSVGHQFREADKEFAGEYVYNVIHARYHLDCLLMALRHRKAIYPEVMEQIQEGLRAAVDAYAWVRQGSGLRIPDIEEAFAEVPWDSEMDALLANSTAVPVGEMI